MKMDKNMTNLEIAELLRAIAASYELKNAKTNKFKIIAYERAADAVEHASSELKDLWDEGKLEEIAGIGKSIGEHLDELFRLGYSKHFEEVMKGLPPAMFTLMELPGIGAKTSFKLVKYLKISDKNPISKLITILAIGKNPKYTAIPIIKHPVSIDPLTPIREKDIPATIIITNITIKTLSKIPRP